MRLKEIKPGMSVHCKNDDEKKALLEEAERLGYVWFEIKRKSTEDVGALLDTIHFYDAGNGPFSAKYKNITQSGRTEGAIEFSDLIIPEMSAEEVLQICSEICNGGPCDECIIGEENCFAEPYSDKKKVIEICQKWKSNHEKKEPEIEWFWKSYVVGGSDCKEADTEQEAMEWCEYYAKEHPEVKCTYKRVCRVKAVE